jgi:hypothetical protein
MSTAVPAAATEQRASSSTQPPNPKLTNSSAALAELLRGSGSAVGCRLATPCPLFPTESEDYYCLSCYTRCSGLSLLVGPHTSHDYLPLEDAVLYMPAALLRETQETAQESEESFTKPWRAQDQQREETLAYLLDLRQRKVSAVAKLMEEIAHVDQQLLHTTEAKALDLSNWRYQQRLLRRRLEKLRCGADTLAASLNTALPKSPSAPSWQHSQQVAHGELAQVQRLITQQLQQIEQAEEGARTRLETWRRLLDGAPQNCIETNTKGPVGAPELSRHLQEQAIPSTEAPSLPVPSPTQTPSAENTRVGSVVYPPTLHPSNAEVVLLQHALLNINDGLRRRLLRAAAASFVSSSSSSLSRSRLPSSYPDGIHDSSSPYTPVMATDITTGDTLSSPLPPLPDETPLRNPSSVGAPPAHARAESGAIDDTNAAGRQRPTVEPPSPPPRQQAHVAASPSGMVSTPAVSGGGEDLNDDAQQEQRQEARWQSWQAQEQALKESLDQLLRGATASAAAGGSTTEPYFASSASALDGGVWGSTAPCPR